MIKRGDFWIGILITILCTTTLFWGGFTIDISLYDTYFVTKYTHLMYPTILLLVVNMILYFLLIKKSKTIGYWMQSIHILLCYLTTIIYICLVWGKSISTGGESEMYFSFNTTIIIFNLMVFIIIQFVFVGTSFRKMIQR